MQAHYKPKRSDGQATPIFVGGRKVAEVCGDTLVKKIRGSKHLLTTPPAIAFDVQSLKDAESAGAVWLDVEDAETKRHYRARLSRVWQQGFEFDRQHGKQIGLPLHLWGKDTEATQPSLF